MNTHSTLNTVENKLLILHWKRACACRVRGAFFAIINLVCILNFKELDEMMILNCECSNIGLINKKSEEKL